MSNILDGIAFAATRSKFLLVRELYNYVVATICKIKMNLQLKHMTKKIMKMIAKFMNTIPRILMYILDFVPFPLRLSNHNMSYVYSCFVLA